MKNYILLATIVAVIASCQLQDPNEQNKEEKIEQTSALPKAIVKEVLQTTNYTYLLADVAGTETWMATPKFNAKPGESYYFKESMKMQDFQSKELNRSFGSIVFVEKISPELDDFKENAIKKSDHQADVKIKKQEINIAKAEGLTTIGDLFSNKNKLAGTMITVKGVVAKYNAGIMGKNWIHLQDGTDYDGHFDLVATSLINCKVGDTLTLEGKLSLDKDFGYGYKYEVLLEDAVKK